MESADDITSIQTCIDNRLDAAFIGNRRIAGVIGDSPSHYSKSPALWNAAFRDLGIDATYLPFDVQAAALSRLLQTVRRSPRLLGVNVTVPHKAAVMDHLDAVDDNARRIKAVNTIVRSDGGCLIGYNTDAGGFIESLKFTQPGHREPFIESLEDLKVLILGAGGSARAVAFALAEACENLELILCNRTAEASHALASDIQSAKTTARTIAEEEIETWAPRADMIVNCTIKGQGGIRKSSDGRATILEPYSALASAHPAGFEESQSRAADFQRTFRDVCREDIEANNRASWDIACAIPKRVRFYDLIYHPEETVFLRHGRLTGHRTNNGKKMIICQAALAFVDYICKAELQTRNLNRSETFKRITEAMNKAW